MQPNERIKLDRQGLAARPCRGARSRSAARWTHWGVDGLPKVVGVVGVGLVLTVLLVACSGGAPKPTGPEPLRTPNGAPRNEALHGPCVPAEIWYEGHPYGSTGIIAHLNVRGQQPLPVFLSPAGLARDAYGLGTKSHPFTPGRWDNAFPVYGRIGTPTREVIVAEFDLVGDRRAYTLYWQYRRE